MLAETQRREMLATMGVDVYVLRDAPAPVPMRAADIRIAVVYDEDDARHSNMTVLRKALPFALGCNAACIDWLPISAMDAATPLPPATAYLLLGAQVAGAAKVRIDKSRHDELTVAVADAPGSSLAHALARRALWQALKPIARRLRETH